MESPFLSSSSSSSSSSPDMPNIPFPFPPFYEPPSDSSSLNSPINTKSLLFSTNPLSDNVPFYEKVPMELSTPPLKEKISTSTTAVEGRDRRRKPSVTKDPEMIASMHIRRRAQNRASQRAFRERKERHVKSLEGQLQNLQGQHDDLLQSYYHQAEEMVKLKDRVKGLTTEIEDLQSKGKSSPSVSSGDTFVLPATFDMVPYSNLSYAGSETSSCNQNMRLGAEIEFLKGHMNDTL